MKRLVATTAMVVALALGTASIVSAGSDASGAKGKATVKVCTDSEYRTNAGSDGSYEHVAYLSAAGAAEKISTGEAVLFATYGCPYTAP